MCDPGAKVRIGVVMPINAALYHNSMRAISEEVNKSRRWTVKVFDSFDINVDHVRKWEPDALLARAARRDLIRLTQFGVPMVTTLMESPLPGVPNVTADEYQIGSVAAQHFLSRRFKNLAVVGDRRAWSIERHRGFCDVAREQVGVLAYKETDVQKTDELPEWLHSLPKPLGVLACNDVLGISLLDACAKAKLRVPHDVAVLGVDNFEYVCDLTDPPMSSVINPIGEITYRAFRMLDAMLRGQSVEPVNHSVTSPGIVTRASTETSGVEDTDVALALEYMRANLANDIGVEDVVAALSFSRRRLEYKFREVLGCTPLEEIHRLRIEHAQELLSRTNLSVSEIATRCGFSSLSQFSTVFHRVAECAPTKYRKQVNGLLHKQ